MDTNKPKDAAEALDVSASSALITLKQFQAEMQTLNEWAQHGCSDGYCQIERKRGMHTNASCTCNPRDFAERLLWLACELDKHRKYGRWPNTGDEARRQNNLKP